MKVTFEIDCGCKEKRPEHCDEAKSIVAECFRNAPRLEDLLISHTT